MNNIHQNLKNEFEIMSSAKKQINHDEFKELQKLNSVNLDKLKKFVKKNKTDQYANFILDSLTIFFTGNP